MTSALTISPCSATTPAWSTIWSTPMYDPGGGRDDLPHAGASGVMVRDIVHVPAIGRTLRIRFSNAGGDAVARFSHASIAMQDAGAGVVAGTTRAILFQGRDVLTLAAHQTMFSDALTFDVPPDGNVAISFEVRGNAAGTRHADATLNSFVSSAARAGDSDSLSFKKIAACYFIDRIDSRANAPAVLLLGDSITAGLGNTIDQLQTYPDHLQRMFSRDHQPQVALNSGINGNGLASDSTCFGRSIQARLDGDALSVPNLRTIVLLAGTNDLVQPEISNPGAAPGCLISAPAIVARFKAAAQDVIARARHRGVRVFLATIPPFAGFETWSVKVDQVRREYNDWIRRSMPNDVIDFDRLLASPQDAKMLAAEFDSGDGLHPNDLAAARMAKLVYERINKPQHR